VALLSFSAVVVYASLLTYASRERTPSLPSGLFNWIGAFFNVSDTTVLQHASLDGYLFLRFLKISFVSCFVGCAICIPVLFAVNITGGGTQQQLDRLSMANVENNYYRYFAHAGCAYLFFGRASLSLSLSLYYAAERFPC
jgi:calcium permeable stress-gated cation channel